MRKILVAIVLLAIGVSVPVAVLVARALESAALEEESRHRSIADRAFDEMESSLSEFLAAEELRPFAEYRFYEELSPTSPAQRRLSPLSGTPQQSFVIGYFQIEPDGRLRTPRRPRDVALAERLGDFRPSTELDELEAKLREAWKNAQLRVPGKPLWALAKEEAPGLLDLAPQVARRPAALPATEPDLPARDFARKDLRAVEHDALLEHSESVALLPAPKLTTQPDQEAKATGEDEAPADDDSERYDTYDILRSFNQAGEKRAQRKQKVYVERALLDAPSKSTPPPGPALEQESERKRSSGAPSSRLLARIDPVARDRAEGAEARLAEREGGRTEGSAIAMSRGNLAGALQALPDGGGEPVAESPDEQREGLQEEVQAIAGLPPDDEDALSAKSNALAGSPAAAAAAVPETVRVALDPMVGRPSDADTLLLYRTVVAGRQGYRQGLLVDWRGLGEWLEQQVIAPSRVARSARVVFSSAAGGSSGAEARSDAAQYVYRHAFAEPFDGFGVELALEPLPGGRGTGTIHALAALLALVGAGGLFALYRMVAVVVEFAERRNRFVAAVSHELKTPLTSIRMYGEMLRDGIVSDDAKRSEYYGTITDESERLSRLIDNVLDFSRLEKGERDVRAQNGPLWPVVLEATEKLRPHAESQGYALVPSAHEPLPDARFDRDVITQIVFNLVDNALKYASAAERREIAVECRERTNGVELSVRDFGPGVPKSDLARIFEPFFRREDELTRTTKGTGIGLALVKELVEAMGGDIEAANADGGGLCIAVRLPFADEDSPKNPRDSNP